jgi:hypothetical protein
MNGICVGKLTIKFSAVSATNVVSDDELEVYTGGNYFVVHGEDAHKFQQEFLKYLGLDKPAGNTRGDGWYGAI